MAVKAVLFDADGVLTLPEEVFSIVYAKAQNVDPEPFEQFFRSEWKSIVIGKKDLKESIMNNPELWHWDGDVDDLLKYWFETEDVRNGELIELIQEIKFRGIPCYLATEQEKYRGEYMKNIMFKDLFDEYFVTAELGVSKTEPEFFRIIIGELKCRQPGIQPDEIMFFDDSRSKVETACSTGINGHLYTSVDQVKSTMKQVLAR